MKFIVLSAFLLSFGGVASAQDRDEVDDSTVTPGLPSEPAEARDIYDGHIALTIGLSMLGQRAQSVNGVLVRGGSSTGLSIEISVLADQPIFDDRLYLGGFTQLAWAVTYSDIGFPEFDPQSTDGHYTGGDPSLVQSNRIFMTGIQAGWPLDSTRYALPGGFVGYLRHRFFDLVSDNLLVNGLALVAGPQLVTQLQQDSELGAVVYVRLGFGVERYTITLPGYKPIGPDWGPLFLLQAHLGPGWFPDHPN